MFEDHPSGRLISNSWFKKTGEENCVFLFGVVMFTSCKLELHLG